jgi:hypothetical protein
MRSALRSIAAVLAGFLAASLVMMLVEAINGRVLYPGLAKAAEGVKDREAMRALFAGAPTGALMVVIGGWTLGSLMGGWVAARLAGRATTGHAFALGVLLLLAGLANNLMMPPPTWFWIASLAVFLPAAYVGARLAPGR